VKRGLLIISVLCIYCSISAFTQQELKKLKNDQAWIVGTGQSGSESKSDQLAIKDLLSQITVQVQSSFVDILTEENGNVQEFTSTAINSYSSARLDAAERSIFEDDGNYIVYRYIRKADRDLIFEERERLIKDYARRGCEAEKELRIGDALMNYYWSLVLLRTHPGWGKIKECFNDSEESLITYLPDRIRRIYSLLDIKIVEKNYSEQDKLTLIGLEVRFNGSPVRNLDLKYYLGNDWSNPVGTTQGKSMLEFLCKAEEIPNPLKINVLYNDLSKAAHNSDLRKVIDEVACPVFRECRFELITSDKKTEKLTAPEVKLNSRDENINLPFYKEQIDKICKAIANKDMQSVENIMTESGEDYYKRVINYGNARIIDKVPQLTVDRICGKTIVRGLPAQFSFPQSNRKFTEELVFVFDENDKIERINFALSEQAINDILGKVQATAEEKFLIVNFIEEYKTAYCTENIDFIEKVFDDNALIIVGQMLKADNKDIEGMYNKLGREWQAVKYTKAEYVRNLKSLFAGNDYVNIHFEDNQVKRANSEDSKIFGVQIHQYYYSEKYADEGYLFLMFDLAEKDNPRIYVRTWQPEKNPDGTVYGLDDFYLPNK